MNDGCSGCRLIVGRKITGANNFIAPEAAGVVNQILFENRLLMPDFSTLAKILILLVSLFPSISF